MNALPALLTPTVNVPKWYEMTSLCTELVMYGSGPDFKFVENPVQKRYIPI